MPRWYPKFVPGIPESVPSSGDRHIHGVFIAGSVKLAPPLWFTLDKVTPMVDERQRSVKVKKNDSSLHGVLLSLVGRGAGSGMLTLQTLFKATIARRTSAALNRSSPRVWAS